MEVDIYDFTDSFIEEMRNEIQDAKNSGKGYGYCYNDLKESADEFYDAYHIKVVGWEELLRKEWDLIKA